MLRQVTASQMAAVVFFLLSASAALQAQSVVTVFPQFAGGGGWSSDIFVDNQGTALATVSASFYTDNGDSLTVDSTLGLGSTFFFNLNGGNTQVVRVGSGGELKTGYVVLSFPNGASIRASEVFRLTQDGVVVATVGVAQQFPFTTFSFPAEVDSARGVNTGLAIANGSFDVNGSAAQGCVVSLIRSDGTLQAMATVNLVSNGHAAMYLNQPILFPGLDGFSGTVVVSALHPIGVVALRQDQAVYGSVSVDNGPVLTPFMLNSGPISEVEPNSSPATAQTIFPPAVIAGTISVAGDTDYFKFVGNQGDVVTAVASTALLNSGLDCIIGLFGSDGTLLVVNDDNGLFFQSDSFLQAVLPADGAYYLAITDASGRGGAAGTYRFHIQVGGDQTRR